MARSILPVLAVVFAAPLAVMGLRLDMPAGIWRAEASQDDLLKGCGDVPEAVALAGELRDRALRIERYMAEIDTRKAELATAEASLRQRLVELRGQRGTIAEKRAQASNAVRDDIARLVAVYDQMKPVEAAAIIANLPPDFAAEILMRVKP
ncbi:MAG: hypothetical protein P3W94_000975, partial [Paracoccus sp. (in: a-proteobacteria)]|nr:hypothetical protein [Paracoccus sp. (in: a-proteobacteria)]